MIRHFIATMLGTVFAVTQLMACTGNTGSELVSFSVFASGPSDATSGAPYSFSNSVGYEITLTKARLHVGAIYLNRSMPTRGAQESTCFLPNLYVAEVTRGLDVDVLSAAPQVFPQLANGTADLALAAEVWLTGQRIDSLDDPTTIAEFAGFAERDGQNFPFDGLVTIGRNRATTVTDPALPGASPLCKQRIVSPIPVRIRPQNEGQLHVRVHPAAWFETVQFSQLDRLSNTPPLYRFRDAPEGQPNIALFEALRGVNGVYEFSFVGR